MGGSDEGDAVVGAFELVAEVGDQTAKQAGEMAERSREAVAQRAAGASVGDLMSNGAPQSVLSLVEKSSKALLGAGSVLRRSLAQGLAKEGWGVAAISRLFGVSHQRISALLQKVKHGE